MRVNEIMTRDVRRCTPETSLVVAAQLMQERGCSLLPVVDVDGRVLGVVTDRDICMAIVTKGRRASDITAWEAASTTVSSCHPDDDVKEALKTMASKKVNTLPVVDHHGVLQGIIAMSDMIRTAGQLKRGRITDLSYEDVIDSLKLLCARPTRRS